MVSETTNNLNQENVTSVLDLVGKPGLEGNSLQLSLKHLENPLLFVGEDTLLLRTTLPVVLDNKRFVGYSKLVNVGKKDESVVEHGVLLLDLANNLDSGLVNVNLLKTELPVWHLAEKNGLLLVNAGNLVYTLNLVTNNLKLLKTAG